MRDVLVLCYHAVSSDWPSPLAVSPERLDSQVRQLLARGYRPTTFHAAVHRPPAPRTLAITFDDAYHSVPERGLPVLAALGVPATVFVPTAFPDRGAPMSWPGIGQWLGGPHEHELRPARWEQLARLGNEGWEIGSHSHSHPRLTQLGDAELRDELEHSKAQCEAHLGGACLTLAYPHGLEDERVRLAARAVGYEAAAALPSPLLHGPDPWRWPRIAVHGGESERVFRRKTSVLRRRLRAGPAGPLIAARRRLPPWRRSREREPAPPDPR